MKRTISAMVGKGSVNHNSRKFKAENVDPSRTHLNIDYCNENIKKVYHQLFGEALKKYNDKQTRADRKIKNYYEKICNSKQEKPFHEIILQIGNKEDMRAESENGVLAKQVLDEYPPGGPAGRRRSRRTGPWRRRQLRRPAESGRGWRRQKPPSGRRAGTRRR